MRVDSTLGQDGEEVFKELTKIKNKSYIHFRNKFLSIDPEIFGILSSFNKKETIDNLQVETEFKQLFYNSKSGKKLEDLFYQRINLLIQLLIKHNLIIKLTSFNSNRKNNYKNMFLKNDEVHQLISNYIEHFQTEFGNLITEFNRKIKFYNLLIRSIQEPELREIINEEYPDFLNEIKDIINTLKEEKITTSFNSSDRLYFKIIDEKRFENKIKKINQDYIDYVSDPIINILIGEIIKKKSKNPKRFSKKDVSDDKKVKKVDDEPKQNNFKIYLGESEENYPIYWIPDGTGDIPKMVSGNILITGGAGSGKTETLKSILYELNNEGFICLALGFHPDLEIKGFKYSRITTKNDIGVNPLDFDSLDEDGGGLPIQIYNVVERLKIAYPSIRDIQEANLIEILEEAYKRKGISEDKKTWEKSCPNFEDIEEILNEKISMNNDKELIHLRKKLNKIFKFKIFSKTNTIDITKLFQESTILDVSKLTDEFLFLVSDTILRKMYRNLKLQDPIEFNAKGRNRFRIFIAIDEAKTLIPPNKKDPKAIINIFGTEARKFGVGFIVSSQLTSHFGNDILGNMATKIALKQLEHNIAQDNAKELSIRPDDLMNINRPGESFIRFSNEKTKKIYLKSYDEKVNE